MRKPLASAAAAAAASLSFAALALPARAQNFQNGSPDTILYGNLRFTASPVQLFGTNGGPDRTGGAFRLGYGVTDSLDVEAKTGFFDGFSLVGGDGRYQFLRGETSLAVTAGGHQAIIHSGHDSTALDLAAQMSRRLRPRVEVYMGPAFSYETIHGVPDSGFSRWYVVPGFRWGANDRFDVLVEGGVGLNHDSPSYVTGGVAVFVPVAAGAHRHRDLERR